MRFTEIRTLTEEQLDELRMNPSSLRAFVDSPEAEGIRAGFEAELVFKGLGGPNDYDEIEPDMDMDERCRSIEEVIDFFGNDEWGYGLSPRGERNLREGLDEMYMEWFDEQMYSEFRDDAERYIREYIEENEWDEDEKIEEHLDENDNGYDEEIVDMAKEMIQMTSQERKNNVEEDDKWAKAYEAFNDARNAANEELESWVEQSVEDQGGYWDAALDLFRDNFQIDDDSGFFSDVGLRWMSDVRDQFDLDWPYMRGGEGDEGGYSYENAERLADDLHEKLGFKTKASDGYHSARRDDVTWIFEPDSSLEASESGDMPVEIISPPMPLKDALANMKAFFQWAESNGAYSNDSTGFHMGISLPHRGGDVDFVKLALFLGDEHVLQEFGRASNHFCEAAMKKIKNRVKGGSADVAGALTLMKNNLLELASRSIQKNGFGKYTSINPNQKYIEFRSAGGHDDMGQSYFEDINKIQNTMMRYAQAMAVAGNPAAERKEYYKKLYKLIAPTSGDIGLDLFARFTSGNITKEELKKQWAENILQKDAPDLVKKSTWELYDKVAGKTVTGQSYSGYSYDEAMERAKEKLSPGGSMEGFKKQYELIDMNQNTGRWSVVDRETGETLEVVDAATRGEAADQVYDKYTKDGKGYFVRPYVEFDKPGKPISRRAELAKRIKQGPKEKQAAVTDIEPNVAQNFAQGTNQPAVQAQQPATREWDNHNYEIFMPRYGVSGGVRQFHANNEEEAQAELERYRAQANGAPHEYDVRRIN